MQERSSLGPTPQSYTRPTMRSTKTKGPSAKPAQAYDWHADAVMTIAGGMAEAEFLKDGCTWRKLEGTRSDRRIVALARRKLGDQARSIAEYEAECERLIKQHWPLIEAVAAKLLKEETLSGNDVYDICWRTARNVVRRQHLKASVRRFG